MDIIWMSRLGLGSGDFGVTSCQINVSNVSLWQLCCGSITLLSESSWWSNVKLIIYGIMNQHCPLDKWFGSRKLPELSPFWYIAIHSHQMSQPTSSVLASFFLFQWLVVHVQSFSRLFLEVVVLVVAPGSWDNPFWGRSEGAILNLSWSSDFFLPCPCSTREHRTYIPSNTWCVVVSSELENMNDTFGASCQWIFGLFEFSRVTSSIDCACCFCSERCSADVHQWRPPAAWASWCIRWVILPL